MVFLVEQKMFGRINYQQQQQLMLGHIKNFQLIYQNKQMSIPIRNKKIEGNKSLIKELNVLRIFTRMAKANSLSQQETYQTKDSQPKKSEERFIVVSKFKNTTAPLQIIPNKFKLHRPTNKSNALNLSCQNQSSSKTFNYSYLRSKQKSVKSTQKLRPYKLPEQNDKKSQILINKVNFTQNYAENKSKNSINQEIQKKIVNSRQRKYSQTLCSQFKQKKKTLTFVKDTLQVKSIKSQSYIVVQLQSEKTVANCRSNFAVQIASLTKIMTFYTVVQIATSKGLDLRFAIIKVSEFVAHIAGTVAELVEGEEYTVQQLLYGLMLPSGNDAANELAYWGGSILIGKQKQYKACRRAFIDEMNKQGRILGLKNTQFNNPHGLPHQNAKSTANDLAKLCCRCMKNTLFRKIVSCREYKVVVKSGKGNRLIEWKNTNKLLRRQGFIGLKTGITVTAGPCLAAAYIFRNKTYISIVLRAPTISSRFMQTRILLFQTLSNLYKDLTQQQAALLNKLNEDNEGDSSSEQQQQFEYSNKSYQEHRRRCDILDYEL